MQVSFDGSSTSLDNKDSECQARAMELTLAVDHSPLGLDNAPADVITTAMTSLEIPGTSVLCEYGVARELRQRTPEIPLIVRLDGNECYMHGDWMDSEAWQLVIAPETAALLKPRGFAINLLFGSPSENNSLAVFRDVMQYAIPQGIDVIVSVYTRNDEPTARRAGVRMACEYGADIISIASVRSLDELSGLAAESFRPLWLGGGSFRQLSDDEYCSV